MPEPDESDELLAALGDGFALFDAVHDRPPAERPQHAGPAQAPGGEGDGLAPSIVAPPFAAE